VNPKKILPQVIISQHRHPAATAARVEEETAKIKGGSIRPSAYKFLRSHWDNLFTIKSPFLFYVCHLRLWSGSGQHGRGLCQELQMPGLQSGL
jgi:hypothetical protein